MLINKHILPVLNSIQSRATTMCTLIELIYKPKPDLYKNDSFSQSCGPPPTFHCLSIHNNCSQFLQRPQVKREEINPMSPPPSPQLRTFLPPHKPPSISLPPLREPKAMDWNSWLSKSNLDDGLVYEYSLLFSHNELEEEDIIHFDHDFLQSMGVSIAKHRLQILKLAKKSTAKSPRLVARLLAAITKTKKSLVKYIQLPVHRDSSAIVVVPRPSYGCSARWKAAMLKRNKGLVLWKQGRLMLTNNGAKVAGENSFSHGISPTASYNNRDSENDGEEDGFWGSAPEEIRWDAMFQDLKPT